MLRFCKKRLYREEGAVMAEYVLMAIFVALASIASFQALGLAAESRFSSSSKGVVKTPGGTGGIVPCGGEGSLLTGDQCL